MDADGALAQEAEGLERRARLRWLWHAVAVLGMILLGIAFLTLALPLILVAAAAISLGATLAMMAETAAKKARLLRAQLA